MFLVTWQRKDERGSTGSDFWEMSCPLPRTGKIIQAIRSFRSWVSGGYLRRPTPLLALIYQKLAKHEQILCKGLKKKIVYTIVFVNHYYRHPRVVGCSGASKIRLAIVESLRERKSLGLPWLNWTGLDCVFSVTSDRVWTGIKILQKSARAKNMKYEVLLNRKQRGISCFKGKTSH